LVYEVLDLHGVCAASLPGFGSETILPAPNLTFAALFFLYLAAARMSRSAFGASCSVHTHVRSKLRSISESDLRVARFISWCMRRCAFSNSSHPDPCGSILPRLDANEKTVAKATPTYGVTTVFKSSKASKRRCRGSAYCWQDIHRSPSSHIHLVLEFQDLSQRSHILWVLASLRPQLSHILKVLASFQRCSEGSTAVARRDIPVGRRRRIVPYM
jgi:hypothetical protein